MERGREKEKKRNVKELVHTIMETGKPRIGQQAGDPESVDRVSVTA